MAYKVFSNGDALTGGELNTYLMNQAVISFATATARDAALPSPSEGQLVWLEDSNKYVYYTGSAWSDLITPAASGNQIINGAFDIWQRGTSFATTGALAYTADHYYNYWNGSGSTTVSQQTFTPGTAPVAGYEGSYFYRYNQSTAGTGQTYAVIATAPIEDVRTFAGQTVTFSFWAKADAARTYDLIIGQAFGSGGSTGVEITNTVSLTTSWARYTQTVSLGSMAGKTIGAGSYVYVRLAAKTFNITQTVDTWGWQLEAGSTATAFKRNASNIQGELAACQRYYWRQTAATASDPYYGFSTGFANGTAFWMNAIFPVTMRVPPTFSAAAPSQFTIYNGGSVNVTSIALGRCGPNTGMFTAGVASGLTTGAGGTFEAKANYTAYLEWTAEL